MVRSANLQPRFPQAVPDSGGGAVFQRFFDFRVAGAAGRGGGEAPADASRAGADAAVDAAGGDGFTLNFENTPVANVAKAVLGDILGVGYVIDPRATGSISLSTGRPVAKKDVLFVLESALRTNNLVMVRDGGGYRIAPLADGGPGGVDANDAEPGYGLTVVPLQYVSGATLAKLLEGFASRPGAIRTDPSGRILLVVGTGPERQSALETVRSFDVDWMRGQSVGMYPVHNSEPEPVVAELEKIMDSGEAGLGHGLVKFQAVPRQNAILVVSAKPELLRTAARWIAQLDSPSAVSAAVKVYKVRYGDAKQIAQLLNAVFVNGGSSATADSATNQIAPSSAPAALTTTERLTGGRPASASNSNAGASAPNPQASPFGGIATAALSSAFAAAGAGGAGGAILPGVRITPDAVTNSILIYASEENYRIIERTLNQIDRPKMQVAIDVTIAEVTLNDQLNYGVQFYLATKLGPIINSSTGQPLNGASTANGGDAPPGFNVFVGNAVTPHAIINALHSLTDVKILSNPSLVVVDNEPATLEVGDQVPITTGSATVLSANNAVVNTVDYKNTGIILHVLPRVSPDNNVLLDIEQEISSVPENSNYLTPTISERKVKSLISVTSGQMVLLAGLVNDTQTKSRSGIPGLTQLPLIGGAFGTTGKQDQRTELIVLIRPQVIRNGADASMVAEQLRAKMRSGRIDALSLPNALNVLAKPVP